MASPDITKSWYTYTRTFAVILVRSNALKYHQLYYLALERRQFDIAIQSNMRLSGIVNCAGFKGSCYLLRAVIPPR